MLDTSRVRSRLVKIIKSDKSWRGGGRGGEAVLSVSEKRKRRRQEVKARRF